MPLDFPTSPVDGQVYNNWVYSTATGAWESMLNGTPPAMLQVSKYADAAARTTAVPSPAEGMLTYLDDINQFQGYQGSSWRGVGGLVPLVAPTIRVSGGSATANSSGVVSFTGVTSIGLDGVLSSTYTNYKLLLNISSASATAATMFRYTANGTATSSSLWYVTGGYWGVNGAGTSSVGNGVADIAINVAASTGFASLASASDVTLTRNKIIANYSGFPNNAGGSLAYGHWNELNPSYDGFRLNPTSGTITGTLQILGFNS